MNYKKVFHQSQKLHNLLKNHFANSNLNYNLCIEEEINILDIFAPYLVLYRYPLFLDPRRTFLDKVYNIQIRNIYRKISQSSFANNYKNISYNSKFDSQESYERNDKKTVLFVSKDSHYSDLMRPLRKNLSDLNLRTISIIIDGDSNHEEKNQLNHSYNLNEILTKKDFYIKEKIFINNRENKTRIIESINEADLKEFNIHKFYIKNEFKSLFNTEYPRILKYYLCAKKIFKKFKPSLLITADDADQRIRLFTALSKIFDSDSLLLQQGLIATIYPEWNYLSCNKIAVFGESTKKSMSLQGVDPDKIFVTGTPGIRKSKLKTKTKVVENIKETIIFAEQPFIFNVFKTEKSKRENTKKIFEILNNCDAKIFIKPHPAEKSSWLLKTTKKYKGFIFLGGKKDISNYLEESSILITLMSTSVIKALMLGKKVIIADINDCLNDEFNIFKDNNLVSNVSSPLDLKREINTMLTSLKSKDKKKSINNSKNPILKNICHAYDLEAVKNIEEIVLKCSI